MRKVKVGKMINVDIHGSCVTREIFNFFDENTKKEIKVNQYFYRQNIVSSMMPETGLPTDFENIGGGIEEKEFLRRSLNYALDKSTVPRLLNSESKCLIVDLFDVFEFVMTYKNTTFSTVDELFWGTPNFKENFDEIKRMNFCEIATCYWYGYIDLYFKSMTGKFDKVILNRLSRCEIYISENGTMRSIMEDYSHNTGSSAEHNLSVRVLEEYIIDRYDVYVMNYTKYFVGEHEATPYGIAASHFEKLYYQTGKDILPLIIKQELSKEHTKEYTKKIFKKTYAQLPKNIISKILRRDFLNEEYLKYHKGKLSPFFSFGLLNSLFATILDIDLLQNRIYIADIYDSLEMDFIDDEFYELEKWKEFFSKDKTKSLFTKTPYLQTKLNNAIDNINYVENLSPEECVGLINKLVDKRDLLWIFVLNVSFCLYKENDEINKFIKSFNNFSR